MIVTVLALLLLQAPKAAPRPAAASPTFTRLAKQATDARTANRIDEAIGLYQKALKLNPKWSEGWFFLGSIYYDQDKHRECIGAFQRFTTLEPKVSAGYAFLGLCQFQVSEFSPALASLLRARQIGLPEKEPLTDVASYHAALLFIREENFEQALQILHRFAAKPELDPKIIEAAGIAALRKPILPRDLAADDRELVYRMGRAVMVASERRASEALKIFDEIVKDYPKTPNVHYAFGTFLIGGDAERGIVELKRELEVQPNHLPSLVLLALEYLRQGNGAEAKPFGEAAVKVGPNNFTSHVVLGRSLVLLDDLENGIRELETAVKLEPTSPQVRIALASAYQKAGKAKEAAEQRTEFQRLKKLLEAQGK